MTHAAPQLAFLAVLLAATGVQAQDQRTLLPGQQYTLTVTVPPTPPASDPPPIIAPTPRLLTGSINVFGDSLAAGAEASTGHEFLTLLSHATGCGLSTNAVNGAQAADFGTSVYHQTGLTASRAFLYETGINDDRSDGNDQGKVQASATTQAAQLAWLAIPDALKIPARSGAGLFTGSTWSPTAVYGLGMRATAFNDTFTITVTGATVYLGFIEQDGDFGQADVYVDGLWRTRVSTNAPSPMQTINGSTYAPQLVRIAGLTNTPHVVSVALITNNPAWPVYIDWVAGLSGDDVQGPSVLVSNTPAGAWSYTNGGSLEGVRALNGWLAETVRALASDGLRIALVDLFSVLNPSGDLAADGYHPNDIGHAKIAAAFQHAMAGWVCQ